MKRSSSHPHPRFPAQHVFPDERSVHDRAEWKIEGNLNQYDFDIGNEFQNQTQVLEQQPAVIAWNNSDSESREPTHVGRGFDNQFLDAARAQNSGCRSV